MEIEEHITSIIAKNLQGEATVEELAQLKTWLDSETGNPQEYEKLGKIWEDIQDVLDKPYFDTNTAWVKLDAAIAGAGTNKGKTRPAIIIALFRNRIAIAAAAVVFFVTAFSIWNINRVKWQTVTAEKSNLLINLPDRSVALLRKGGTIKYPASFDKDERKVTLSGEAFFDVHRNEKQPFVITTAHSAVKVLGTSFLVRSTSTLDEVVVVTGKVSVADNQKTENRVLLIAGQKVILQNEKFLQSQVQDSNYIAWKNGLLDFKDATLSKVLEDVAHYYEIPLGISDEHGAEIEKIRINVRFQNQSLGQVLEEIKLITGLEIKKENNKTIFYQK